MKIDTTSLAGYLRQIKKIRLPQRGRPRVHSFDEPPLRSELFSAEQMEQHGKRLAASHRLSSDRPPQDHLLTRLAENEALLLSVYGRLTAAVKAKQQITPASEWLLDNYYLVEEQVRTAKRHFPKNYSRELPRLASGPSEGLPRVYDIALETIAHGDGRVDPESLGRIISAYQTVSPLKIGELWAIPIMLRLALIENLRRVGVRIAAGRIDRDQATMWAEQMRAVAEKDPKSLVLLIADMARSNPPLSTPFVSEFTRRLQGQNSALALPLTWIDQVLSESGLSIEQLVQTGNQQQAADQVSVSNSIGSLRFLGAMDWRRFVESMSIVEAKLREDPSGAYPRMDFSTRDSYRHAIEKIAKHSALSEVAIAEHAVRLALAAQTTAGASARTTHVGYYLVDSGIGDLEKAVNASPSASVTPTMRHPHRPLYIYLGSIGALTFIFTAFLMSAAQQEGVEGGALALLGVLLVIATSQLALALVNWLATVAVAPHPLPRMDFSNGIPDEARTLVAVPTMLLHQAGVNALIEALEVRFLANNDDNLYFALVTDFADADHEHKPEDAALLEQARSGINALNKKYPCAPGRGTRFFLFHRPRRFNSQEQVWMGFERKRGKLGDLNAVLRGDLATAEGPRFSHIEGEISSLAGVRYVITLDTDTQLPRDAAHQCIGTLAHPLNRAVHDPIDNRVKAGYGILQPRVSASLAGTNRSRYAQLFGGETGLDPYSRTVSDVYQDIFAEGSFIGKGIYDVDTFEQVLNHRYPDNRILSHDLLEGCYARAGLISNVEVYEDYPPQYSADVNRRHRWIRGDWQLLPWLLPHVPLWGGRSEKNPLSGLAKWKLFDNLRRSLVPAALIMLLLLAWTLSVNPGFWTLAIIGVLVIPPAFAIMHSLVRPPKDLPWDRHLSTVFATAVKSIIQMVFTLACLPYEAYFSLDAIGRSVWRTSISRKRLLEWNPSSEAVRTARTDLKGTLRSMWIGPALAAATTLFLAVAQPATLGIAAPVLALWFVSPLIAWWISVPVKRRDAALSPTQWLFLRKLSRRTWRFFETFVTAQDNWLPPDNFQEHPDPVIAHRTSPTNIGLALLANLAAYDFGYIAAGQLLRRTANTVKTMNILARHRGHLYNWYDTVSLKPLHPLYVSSVDSGNLAGHVLTLRAGLLELADAKIIGPRWLDGVNDTFQVLLEHNEGDSSHAHIVHMAQSLETMRREPANTLQDLIRHLDILVSAAEDIVTDVIRVTADPGQWGQALLNQCQELREELRYLCPWIIPPATWASADFSIFERIPTLRDVAALDTHLAELIAAQPAARLADDAASLDRLQTSVQEAAQRARARLAEIDSLVEQVIPFAQIDYDFLYDKKRHLLAIGYNVDEMRCDASHYDLLASEARLCNFVAIAQGKLPQESWFALGRQLTSAGGDPILVSWSGSMFEYLMPLLVMPTFENTLLHQTYQAAVARQIEYGRQRGVSWGMSESGYNTTDTQLNYQYRAFGVPGLGLKRGLGDDLVIAPYASALALMVTPEAACANLERLETEALLGAYGFYEAIDYTPSRLPRGQNSATIRSFMAHHQGMSLLALLYLLLDQPMQRRFASDPLFQATMSLLQERIPKAAAHPLQTGEQTDIRSMPASDAPVRVLANPNTPLPEVQLLSNGRYHVMVTQAGGGYSRWKDLAVTRWREDTTRDCWGSYCYLRDVASGGTWSTAFQPTATQPQHYEAIFSEGRAEFRRRDYDYETHTEIIVSPEDDVELRRVKICNRTRNRRSIVITSYAEVVLAAAVADALHPSFSNLFVQTEIVASRHAILCTRRPRAQTEKHPWMVHLMAVHDAQVEEISYETDRARFIGRGRTTADPHALTHAHALSDSEGSVLDPIVAVRYIITIEGGQTATVDMVTGIGEARDAALSLAEKYQDRRLADRAFELAWTHAQVVLRQLNASEADAQLYARLANSIVYANASLRADAHLLMQNRRGQPGLWGYAISGDLPIVLLQIGDAGNIDLVRQLVQAHTYWRSKGLAVDLVIWNEDHAGYRQLLQEQIMDLIVARAEMHVVDRPGGIFVRPVDQISHEDRILFQSVARVIINDQRGTLSEQVNRRATLEVRTPRLQAPRVHISPLPAAPTRRELMLHNGLGGFTPDGKEYVITTTADRMTPAPWVNILANPGFGSVISESGSGYTWGENAHEFRLTPWHNDPVSDGGGEAFYLRDEETGHYWSPTPLPCRGAGSYVTRHGFGYSVFEHCEDGIRSEFWIYTAIDTSVKFFLLKLTNESSRLRKLSAMGYVEWILGDLRQKTAMHIVTEIDSQTGALFARNPYNVEFADRTAFFYVDDRTRGMSGDRSEFIGRNGSLKQPAALARTRLSGRVGAGFDACGAIHIGLQLEPGEKRECVFLLGLSDRHGIENARRLVQRFRDTTAARGALDAVRRYWDRTLGAVQIETPDPALNVLANGWLVYQTLACRVWARSGYYQSGGAFGFRDQLQDVMALIYADPQRVRDQLVLSAAHQFVEGDVQHWWHPPANRGVRTRCSDDYLWLPLATCRYVAATGDYGVLTESISFLEGRPVNPEDDSYYDLPGISNERASLYDHCVRAIRFGLRFGSRGLPLMGSGDWNDGMNLVGIHGKGESVWLGFFLCDVLTRFADLAERHGDVNFAQECRDQAASLRARIEENAWDGQWYRRAYFDDGTPLGSATNDECQIDSISQSWSILSLAAVPGATASARSHQAMEAVYTRLVRKETGLIQLLDPPFNRSNLDPGYIKGYVPGVRENGGQYTHAAIWTTMAFAALGDHERAWELLSMINPINHSRNPQETARYKVEPYVVAADVYGVDPHAGRGGWTWYTGSAGWMYRLVVESLLGLRVEVDTMHVAPRMPHNWASYTMRYRFHETYYAIRVSKSIGGSSGEISITLDGARLDGPAIRLANDKQEHVITVQVADSVPTRH